MITRPTFELEPPASIGKNNEKISDSCWKVLAQSDETNNAAPESTGREEIGGNLLGDVKNMVFGHFLEVLITS